MTRDVTDADGSAWSCTQAYAGLGDTPAAQAAAERAASEPGTVVVVCTPSGGEMSVRLELPIDWAESLSDDQLLAALDDARRNDPRGKRPAGQGPCVVRGPSPSYRGCDAR